MFGFTFLTSMIFHPFWSADPATVMGQLNNFMKNLAIMGGMLYVMVHGAGPLSLDRARETGAANGKTGPAATKKRNT